MSYMEKISGIGMTADFTHNTAFCFGLSDDHEVNELEPSIRGHYSLDTEFRNTQSEELQARYDDLFNDLSALSKRKEDVQALYQAPPLSDYSTIHLDRIETLIGLSAEKGYQLIFVLPPRLPERNYKQLLPLFAKLDDQHKIDLANPTKFPAFYEPDNSFDMSHLNDAGLVLYTRALAEALNALVEQSSN